MAYQSTNPYTGEVLKTFPNTTDAELEQAITKAHEAFLSWRETDFATRSGILAKAASILRAETDDFAKIMTTEMGKTLAEARAEVELSAQILDYYVTFAEELLKPTDLDVKDPQTGKARIYHEPLGVLLAIEPWNFPLYQVIRILAPQISAGNTLLLKHASNLPQSAAKAEDLLRRAGLPDGCFTNLYPTHAQIERIISDPRVHGVALTGSEGAGAKVAAQAGKALKKTIMELGGADAFVVLDDADIEKTAKWAVFGRHWNAGQVCVSAKRLIVADKVYDRFMDLYMAGVAKLRAGDPMDESTTLAPLSSQGAVDDLKKQLAEAVSHGAKAVEAGISLPNQGAFFQPTILTDIDSENPARHFEFFGPVSMVFRAKDEKDAIRIANDTPYGLGGSVFTQNEERGVAVARQIETGMVFINHPTMVKADLPFGGVRRSGFGRELVDLGIKEFVNHKLVDVVDIDAPF
ncbi:NAD-dependent succinate-semialdehyde dehydrogenase [Acetobacter sp. AN02]|uniref:NAD-dependent succinate-semialdehyde dehydrogenase n=1 Tax=Acetobacter sp. AN02 TaxID=2894186 RepID=UPI00243457BA|nr:NAD-dependent succinate-semialdehyde dehydrogenase [Acetobacter sp. AN02]MDG6093600.1 NAD-dependent succinate-semialdehyde dehydrogenase [Acetobacter sp. AN02]